MVSIKFEGKQPTLDAMREMKFAMARIRKYGNKWTANRYFVFEGSILRAGQSSKIGGMKYMKKGRTLFTIKS